MKTTLKYPAFVGLGSARFGHAPRRIPATAEHVLSLFILFAGMQAASAQKVYVLNYGGGSASVIDSATNTVTATIPGLVGPDAAAIQPTTNRVYVANYLNGTISVIDTSSNSIVSTIVTGDEPYGLDLITASPDGGTIYAGGGLYYIYAIDTASGSVSQISKATNASGTLTLEIDSGLAGLAVSPDSTTLYVADGGLVAIVPKTGQLLWHVNLPGTTAGLILSPDGKTAYVPASVSNQSDYLVVYAIDLATQKITATIGIVQEDATSLPFGIAMNPAGTMLYMTVEGLYGYNLLAISTVSNAVVATETLGVSMGSGVAVTPDGSRIYVSDYRDNVALVFDAATNTRITTVTVGVGPRGIVIPAPLSGTGPPSINPSGVVPVFSTVPTIEPGSWVSIYGSNLASGTAAWNGDFPTMLGGTSVTIDGRQAYLWYVSPGQINLQVPNDTTTGSVTVVVKTGGGTASTTVTLSQFGPSLSLLDGKHVAGIILRSDGSGAYGGGTYDIIGPTGTSLGYRTVAAKAGDSLELFGVGFGPTNPTVAAGKPFSGSAPATNTVQFLINGTAVTPAYAGITSAGLYQFNIPALPSGLGTGDVTLQATVAGISSPSGVMLTLQ
jgi:uncharacterized protein (TIGR03437 family)